MTYRTQDTRPYSELNMIKLREGLPSDDAFRSELENGAPRAGPYARIIGTIAVKTDGFRQHGCCLGRPKSTPAKSADPLVMKTTSRDAGI